MGFVSQDTFCLVFQVSINLLGIQLCEDMQTEVCSTSDGRTSSSEGHVTPVDQQNGELWKKPLKEEETDEDEDFVCKAIAHLLFPSLTKVHL